MVSDNGSESGSDVEMKTALPKKVKKKLPKSPTQDLLENEPKKLTTKDMIHQALIDLKSRKGASLYAIKKYMVEKYSVDTDKINYYIKKYIKIGVEKGTILQIKGIGASGSFKLAAIKPEKKKTKKSKADKPKKMEKANKPKMMKKSDSIEKTMEKKITKKKAETKPKPEKKEKTTKKEEKESKLKKTAKNTTEMAAKEPKKQKTVKIPKMAKEKMTPAKKRAVMMKRKSIGSIIKPPKMKPKSKD